MTDVAEQDDEFLLGDLEDESGARLTDMLSEHRLIAVLLDHPDAAEHVRDLVSSRDFFDRAVGRLFDGIVAAQGFVPTNDDMVKMLGGEEVVVAGRKARQFIGYLHGMRGEFTPADAEGFASSIYDTAELRYTQQGQTNLVGLDGWSSKMGLITFAERETVTPDSYDYLVEDLIPEREITLLIGPSQAGKSFLTYDLAMCIARGVPFFGRRVLKPQPVVWCAYEGGRGARGRMLAYASHHNIKADIPFAALTRPVDLWSKDLNVEELIKEVEGVQRAEFGGVGLGALVIDTHNAATPGMNEIDGEHVSKIRDRYKRLAQALECAVIVIGHTNALGKHRGNEQLYNNVETTINVSKKTQIKDRQPVPVRDNDGREVRTVEITKQREGETGHVCDFVLPAISTGLKNKFGKERTSCVVAAPNFTEEPEQTGDDKTKTKLQGYRLSSTDSTLFDVFWKQVHEAGLEAPPELQLPRGTRVIHRETLGKAFRVASIPEDGGAELSENTLKSRWKRATDRLRDGGIIVFREPYFWWTGKAVIGRPATYSRQRTFFDDMDEERSFASPYDFPEDF